MKTNWNIAVLDPKPAMTCTHREVQATFAETCKIANELFLTINQMPEDIKANGVRTVTLRSGGDQAGGTALTWTASHTIGTRTLEFLP